MKQKRLTRASALLLLTTLAACGGDDKARIELPVYSLGGTISGLNGSVVLQLNNQPSVILSSNGAFTLSEKMHTDDDYKVRVIYHPVGNSCIVTNGEGAIADRDVNNISVVCGYPAVSSLTAEAFAKQLKFSWDAIADAAYYQLFTKSAHDEEYTQLDGNVTGTQFQEVIAVHKLDWENASYYLLSCDTSLCSAPSNTASPYTLSKNAIGYFKASNSEAGDHFGAAVAISGDGKTLAVGSPYESGETNANYASGAVYVFSFDPVEKTWQQQGAPLKASNEGAGDQFGYSLALSEDGNTLVIGAPGESSDLTQPRASTTDHNDNATFSGAVYVYTRSGATWSEQAFVKASNTRASDRFGSSLALSADGDTLAVGAIYQSGNAAGINQTDSGDSATWSGAAYVYNRANIVWSQQAYIKADNRDNFDQFGHAVALSVDGNTLAVSAIGEAGSGTDESNNSLSNAGAVYTFNRNGATWSKQAYLKPSNPDSQDNFGYALDFNANATLLAIGSPREASASQGIDGAVNNEAPATGAVYLFALEGDNWLQQSFIKATNAEQGDLFGSALSFNKTTGENELAVGAPNESSNALGIYRSYAIDDGNQNTPPETPPSRKSELNNQASAAGAVYFFQLSDDEWVQKTYIKASNSEAGDRFGQQVKLDNTGDTLAVSAERESSPSTGIGGKQTVNTASEAGAIYLY